jgi:CubicO group peptidase (beta-lactamase class C family)
MAAKDPEQLVEEIEAYAANSRPPLHSFLVLHRGKLLAERYWCGFAPTSHLHVYSVTKSFVSALVGLALADGKLALSDTLAEWFPEVSLEGEAASVTIRHLLTMTAGFEQHREKLASSEPLMLLLRRRSVSPPGDAFGYNNEDPSLLVGIIERAVGEPALDYAQRRLFAPLGIWQDVPKSQRKRLWKTDKQGRIKGGYGLHLMSREMAIFGQLYAQGGTWEGTQLIPADYVMESTSAQAPGGWPERVRYGYYWWVLTDSTGHPAFFASGMGGNYIYVVPALDLVVVITSEARILNPGPHRVMAARIATRFITSQEAAG